MSKRFYHIQRINGIRKEWKKSEIVEINDKSYNNFYQDLINTTGDNELIKRSKNTFKKFKVENETVIERDLLKENIQLFDKSGQFEVLSGELFESLLQYLKWIREEIFESIRSVDYPKLPSRKHCLWITEKQNIQDWWVTFGNHLNKKILEIEPIGNFRFHQTDGSLIKTETYRIEEYYKLANSYWNETLKNDNLPELLFQGTFKVINEYSSPNQILN